jgi:hypothetical protein
MKTNLLILVVEQQVNEFVLVDSFSDQEEIDLLLHSIEKGEEDPLLLVHQFRKKRELEEEEFGDTVEELLQNPFLNTEIRNHGLEWFKSRIRMEKFRSAEQEAREVVSAYAFQLFQKNPRLRDFTLEGQNSAVRVKVLEVLREEKIAS